MTENEIVALMRLQHIPGLGPLRIKKLITAAGSPTAVFTDQLTERKHNIPKRILAELQSDSHKRAAEVAYERNRKAGIRCLGYLSPDYPLNLLHCADSPVLLYAKGNMDLSRGPVVSVVGTRSMTTYGKQWCKQFIRELAGYKPIIISGFAYGIDICAQRQAIECGLQTIACMAHGLDRIYPREHRKYVDVVAENGGFLTEFWMGTPPEPTFFLRRNRLIAGLSRATVVVESPSVGGSLVTADLAFGYDREVFAVPGRTGDACSQGCNGLIHQNKAQLLRSADDFVQAMGWEMPDGPAKIAVRPIPQDFDKADRRVAHYLNENPDVHLDDIALSCEMDVSEASARLFRMEMDGFIEAIPGKKYRWKPS
jgi:DNA processing protein